VISLNYSTEEHIGNVIFSSISNLALAGLKMQFFFKPQMMNLNFSPLKRRIKDVGKNQVKIKF